MQDWDKRLLKFKTFLEYEECAATNTVVAYAGDCSEFLKYFKNNCQDSYKLGNVSLKEAKKYVIYLRAKNLKRITIARKLDSLKKFINYLIAIDEFQNDNPFSEISYPKPEFDRIDYLKKDEISSLMSLNYRKDFIGYRDQFIVNLFYCTGLRLSELVILDLGDIHFTDNKIKIFDKKGRFRIFYQGPESNNFYRKYIKMRKYKSLTIKNKNKNALFLNNRGSRITARSVGRIVADYLKLISGKGKLSSHSLRSSFAHHLFDNGMKAKKIQKKLGHSSIIPTYIYNRTKKVY